MQRQRDLRASLLQKSQKTPRGIARFPSGSC